MSKYLIEAWSVLLALQSNNLKSVPATAFFTHPDQVHVLRLPADDGVLFRYALSALLKRKLRSIWNAEGAAAAADVKNSGLALPGILMTRSAAK